MPLVNKKRIQKAIEIFEPNAQGGLTIKIPFFTLGNEIQERIRLYHSIKRSKKGNTNPIYIDGRETFNLEKHQVLSRFFKHSFTRFGDLFIRLELLDWLCKQFSTRTGKAAVFWFPFGSLTIKDFHADLSSLMDSLAPIVIQATVGLKPEDIKKPPGFADIQKNSKRGYRASIPRSICKVLDASDRWWVDLKKIRDILSHREHEKLVYGSPSQGVFFQIYGPDFKPKVVDHALLSKKGNKVVDFDLYSAFVMAELLLFLEELGQALIKQLKFSKGLGGSFYMTGNFDRLLGNLGKLLKTK